MGVKLLTSADVAERCGCIPDTVTRVAKANGVGTVVGRVRIYSEADVRRLRELIQDGPGCPLFVAGNQMHKRRQKATRRKPRRGN
jgi:hypothetical protein